MPKKVPNCNKIKINESKYDNKKNICFSKKHVSNDVSNGNTKSAELVVVLLFPKMFPNLKKMETKSTSKNSIYKSINALIINIIIKHESIKSVSKLPQKWKQKSTTW